MAKAGMGERERARGLNQHVGTLKAAVEGLWDEASAAESAGEYEAAMAMLEEASLLASQLDDKRR